ncbi:MAG TPA: outer membrane beta-barrel protein [Xanthobacteraceae bacterium]|nr:outer membrane beta-barrel protein [Xanthobacteraceae bacterium]
MTSRVLFGALALGGAVAFASGAQAADLRTPPPAMPAAAPVAYAPQIYNWSGFYVGGHLGGGYGASSWSDPFGGGNNNFNDWGFLGGAQVGANAQFNRLVLGLEGDFSWTNINNKGTDSIGDGLNTNVQWTSTVTGRVGAAFDRLLVYGKGGLALAEDQSTLTDFTGTSASNSLLRTGWTAGAGLEYAIDQNWSARVEYDYLGFGSQAMNFTTPALGTVSSNTSLNVQEIKAGLNFRFGGGQ